MYHITFWKLQSLQHYKKFFIQTKKIMLKSVQLLMHAAQCFPVDIFFYLGFTKGHFY